jgi:rubredoxin
MMDIETFVTVLLSCGVLGIFWLWLCCDWQDTVRMRLRWKRSAFLCRKCDHIYEAQLPRKKKAEATCPHCGTENTPSHF